MKNNKTQVSLIKKKINFLSKIVGGVLICG